MLFEVTADRRMIVGRPLTGPELRSNPTLESNGQKMRIIS